MSIHVELVTPERLLFREEVDFVAAPTSTGEIGILPNHAPLLSKLGMGTLRLKRGSETQYIAIAGGFLEVQSGSRVSIFAETAEFAGEIDVERAKQAAERAKKQLSQPADLTAEELARVEAALTRALLRLNVAQYRRRVPAEQRH